MRTSFIRRALAPLALSALFAMPAHAQERQLFTWTGRVDRSIQLTVRGSSAQNSRENNMQTRGRFRMASALPMQDGVLRVEAARGRGSVSVVQQPMQSNDYTAIIDIQDNEGGADNYVVNAYWTPSSGSVLGNRGRGNGRGYGNTGRNDDNRPGRGLGRGEDRGQGRGDDRGQGRGEDRGDSRGNMNGNLPSLRWSGEVDSVIELQWRGGTVSQRLVNGAGSRNTSSSVSGNANVSQNGNVVVNVRSGRGRVEVVQQPTAQNRYTTIIRITDPEPGYGRYVIDASWQ